MGRKIARETAMKLIYQMDIHREAYQEMIERTIEEYPDDLKDHAYIREVTYQYLHHQQLIDDIITQHAKDWKLDRIAKVDLAILRLAIVEMLYQEDIPTSVSINEAVEMAKNYSTDESGSFVNGVLGSVAEMKK
ncbi:MAG: transcription antitermination factor NusB [Thermotaleaceae bacterium]